jgi:hypothetical protein
MLIWIEVIIIMIIFIYIFLITIIYDILIIIHTHPKLKKTNARPPNSFARQTIPKINHSPTPLAA